MKRIRDYPDDMDFTGFRVRGLATGKVGTVLPQVPEDFGREVYWNILWDGDDQHSGGWFFNDCEVEVVSEGPGVELELKWEEQSDCQHESVMPTFDKEAALDMTADEVRKRWPRFSGSCPKCRRHVILYASYAHYLMGDW